MRETKFRVLWNGQPSLEGYTIGDFIDGVELEFADGGSLPMNDIDWGSDSVKYIQYTGLKDKNGVEIYEGDVLRWRQERWLRHVDFKSGSFTAVHADHCHHNLSSVHERDLEIVGNVYEHPELLEAIK